MFTAVIIINLGICLLCLFVARKIWQLRKTLSSVADTLINAERQTHNVLYGAPKAMIGGQQGTRILRKRYGGISQQLVKVQQLLNLMSLLLGVRHQLSRGHKRYVPKRY